MYEYRKYWEQELPLSERSNHTKKIIWRGVATVLIVGSIVWGWEILKNIFPWREKKEPSPCAQYTPNSHSWVARCRESDLPPWTSRPSPYQEKK